MKALVTGGTGFLGRHVVDRLREHGVWVRALVRSGRTSAVRADEICEGDLRARESLARAVEGVDWVVHAGARVKTFGDWQEFEATNVEATNELIRVSVESGVRRFVHVSSLSVYAVAGDGALIDEDAPLEAGAEERGSYARSKLAADRVALGWIERGAPVVVARPGLLYGAGRRPPLGRRAIRVGPLCLILTRPSYLLPLAYVENVADGLLLAARTETARGRVYNLVDHPIRQREYVKLYRRVSGDRFAVLYMPLSLVLWLATVGERVAKGLHVRPPVTRHQVARTVWSAAFTSARAEHELGWRPPVSLEEGLRRTFASLRG